MGFPVLGLGDLAYFIEAHRASVGFREPLLDVPEFSGNAASRNVEIPEWILHEYTSYGG